MTTKFFKNYCLDCFPGGRQLCLTSPQYVVHSISFQTFFVQAFQIVEDSWKFSMLLLYILWDNWPIFMISGSNEQLQQGLEYILLKSDCHSWWLSKMQSGREDTLEERYAIKFCLSQTIWPRWASTQFVSFPIVQTLLPVTFGYSPSSEAVVMRELRRWKRLWRRSLIRSHKRTSMGPSRSCWNGTTSALQPEEITPKGTRVSCVYYQ